MTLQKKLALQKDMHDLYPSSGTIPVLRKLLTTSGTNLSVIFDYFINSSAL